MNKITYEPETLEEEFAFLAGRVAALEAILNADNSDFIDKKDIPLKTTSLIISQNENIINFLKPR